MEIAFTDFVTSQNKALDCSKHQHIETKWSVLWLSNYAKMRFMPGSAPNPLQGTHDAHIRLGRRHPSHTPSSALAICVSPRIPAISTPMQARL